MFLLPMQQRHDGVGRAGIQTRGGLIQKQHGGSNDQLHTYVGALSLPAGHAPDEVGTKLSRTLVPHLSTKR